MPRPWLRPRSVRLLFALAFVPLAVAAACSATSSSKRGGHGNNGSGADGSGAGDGTGGTGFFEGGTGGFTGDPKTCEQAAQAHTYIGCDFWPTVTANNVWSIFDYAVVIANAGDEPADATVTRGGQSVASVQVAPNGLQTIYLPWVPELKGPDADVCGSATPVSSSARVPSGAYHLVTTRPITVYQFNALEYTPQGGPPNKNWSSCPGNQICPLMLEPVGCFSYSNDASLLLPATAMTTNYRVTASAGWQLANIGGYITITGTADGTNVSVKLSPSGQLIAGGGIPDTPPGGTATFSLGAGEVAQLVAPPSADLSGSLVQASAPVQVITGMPCVNVPPDVPACDHIEESVFPAETLGQHYFVVQPSGPAGNVVGHQVRIYGNVDGTALSYPAGQPPGAPGAINAGQVVDLGIVNMDFEVVGDKSFAVASFLMGGELVDPQGEIAKKKGDPAQSLATAVEQFRTKYVFLAPLDYDVNFVFVIMPAGTTLTLDGAPVNAVPAPIGGSSFGVARVQLGPGSGGAHVLTATSPVGIQVAGYGAYTSYYYPGGLDLKMIAPPPVK
ncbi:MAG: IgGFc-binding protein [Deltaproteobacteria bacterium]|nr:IgGFc-binding protein [Deltaproteobacteria bacterium]